MNENNQTPNENLTIGEKISKYITDKIGTIQCAIIFFIIALVSLPQAIKSGDTIIMVSWLAQTFLQLVLLPIIMIGQNIQSRKSESLENHIYELNQSIYDNDIKTHIRVDEIHDDVKKLLKIDNNISEPINTDVEIF